jgi:chemotaxis-related protein WspB
MSVAAVRKEVVFLLFQMGADRYALDVRRVAEVVPLVALKQLPQAPNGVAGVFDYRGRPVPVIDLSQLATGRAASQRLGTRIVMVDYAGGAHLLGLIAEKATETFRRDPESFAPAGVASAGAPYLGPVCMDARGMIQWIDIESLLPESVSRSLFAAVKS